MNTTLTTLILIISSITVVYLCSSFIPFLLRFIAKQLGAYIYRSSNNRKRLKKSFINEEKHPGKIFVKILYVGLYKTIKTSNHGRVFPDDQVLNSFKKHGTQYMKDALDEIGGNL